MLTTDEVWLAGLLEGEGCFSTGSTGWGHAQIALSMTDRDVIDRAMLVVPNSTNIYQFATKNKTAYAVSWNGRIAVDLMFKLLPQMGARRSDRMLEIISNWLEARMTACMQCGREFSAQHRERQLCGAECKKARIRENAHKRKAR